MRITTITIDELAHLEKRYPAHTFLQSQSFACFAQARGYTVHCAACYEGQELRSYCVSYITHAKRGTIWNVSQGPVFVDGKLYDEFALLMWAQFWKAEARKHACSCIRLAPAWERSGRLLDGFHLAPTHLYAEQTFVIELNGTDDELLAKMRKSTRQLIRKALKQKDTGVLRVEHPNQINEEMWKVYDHTVTRGKFVGASHAYILDQLQVFSRFAQTRLVTVSDKSKLLSWGMIIIVGKHAFYQHGANVLRKDEFAPYLVYWELFRLAREAGCTTYDVWGASPKNSTNHPWFAISRYKAGFGGTYKELEKTMDMPLSLKYWPQWLFELIRSWKRGFGIRV